MKPFAITVVLFLAAGALLAGVTYDFRSETTGMQQTSLDGTVAVEGANLKMTVTHGDGMMFKSGTMLFSRDGGKTLTVFDPSSKTYYHLALDQLMAGAASALNSAMVKLTFDAPNVTVKDAGAGGAVAGFPTEKMLVDASIAMHVDAMGQTMSSKLAMHSESWTTDKIDAGAMNLFQQQGLLTGIDGLDKLIAAQAASFKGRFPLKQVTTIHLTQNGRVITTTTTASVSNVKQRALDGSAFAAPSGYTRVDGPLEGMKKRS